jgi:hypothetical protein
LNLIGRLVEAMAAPSAHFTALFLFLFPLMHLAVILSLIFALIVDQIVLVSATNEAQLKELTRFFARPNSGASTRELATMRQEFITSRSRFTPSKMVDQVHAQKPCLRQRTGSNTSVVASLVRLMLTSHRFKISALCVRGRNSERRLRGLMSLSQRFRFQMLLSVWMHARLMR